MRPLRRFRVLSLLPNQILAQEHRCRSIGNTRMSAVTSATIDCAPARLKADDLVQLLDLLAVRLTQQGNPLFQELDH